MSKKFKYFLIVIIIIILAWFVPIIPFVSWKISGIPGCNTFALRTLRSIIIPDQSNIAPAYRTPGIKIEKPIEIISIGSCYWN